MEAHFGVLEAEQWWPAVVTKVWASGEMDVRYDDGDVELKKPASRVRALQPSAAKAGPSEAVAAAVAAAVAEAVAAKPATKGGAKKGKGPAKAGAGAQAAASAWPRHPLGGPGSQP